LVRGSNPRAGTSLISVLAEWSGWVVAVLTGVTITLPYLLRRRLRWAGPYLERLRPHYWIGFTIAGLSLIHAGLAMSSGPIPGGVDWTVGIWVATGAMLLVFGQLSLGLGLSRPVAPERKRRRRLHFLTMTLLVAGGGAHAVLNGPLLRGLLHLS
jgi:cytochrome b561